jgi:hypothetical protein
VKILLLVLLATLLVGSAYTQQTEKIAIPAGVNYKYSSDNKIKAAKQLIEQDIADSTSYQLSSNSLIVGPMLWRRYQHVPTISQIKEGHVTFKLDPPLEGKLAQSLTDTRTVWAALRREVAGQPYTIRKATEQELQYYWAVISFDIEEPLLIIETQKHRYILNIIPKDMKLMWLDEAPAR